MPTHNYTEPDFLIISRNNYESFRIINAIPKFRAQGIFIPFFPTNVGCIPIPFVNTHSDNVNTHSDTPIPFVNTHSDIPIPFVNTHSDIPDIPFVREHPFRYSDSVR